MTELDAVISECTYENLKANIGGAILINRVQIYVTINSSIFLSCSSSGKASSSCRETYPSGGSLFIDVKCIDMNNIYTSHSKAAGFGHAIYCCCPINQYMHINCYSDFNSGQVTGIDSGILFSEYGISVHTSLNFTYPANVLLSGAIHIGIYPISSDVSYINVVCMDNDADTAIGLSSADNGLIKCSYVNVVNCQPSTNAIFVFWKGSYELSFIYVIDCIGLLVKFYNGNPMVTFANCYFSKSVVTDNSIKIENTFIEAPDNNFTTLVCSTKKQSIETCHKIKNFRPSFVALLVNLMK